MKTILIFLAGIILGLILAFSLFNVENRFISKTFIPEKLKNKIITEYLSQIQPFRYDPKPKETRMISEFEAERLVADFRAIGIDIPGDTENTLVKWPRELTGWVLNADLLNVLLKQKSVKNINIELGLKTGNTPQDNLNTLIFTSMDEGIKYKNGNVVPITTVDVDSIKYKKINEPKLKPNYKKTDISNILEYVNPCRPNCPQ